jgi:hypothetical protein
MQDGDQAWNRYTEIWLSRRILTPRSLLALSGNEQPATNRSAVADNEQAHKAIAI